MANITVFFNTHGEPITYDPSHAVAFRRSEGREFYRAPAKGAHSRREYRAILSRPMVNGAVKADRRMVLERFEGMLEVVVNAQ